MTKRWGLALIGAMMSFAGPMATHATPAAPGNAAEDSASIELVVAKGRLVSGPSVTKVKANDRVRLAITTDAADELHLHGYNLHLPLKPGQRAVLEWLATRTGRFTYELHHADISLGAVEVYPR